MSGEGTGTPTGGNGAPEFAERMRTRRSPGHGSRGKDPRGTGGPPRARSWERGRFRAGRFGGRFRKIEEKSGEAGSGGHPFAVTVPRRTIGLKPTFRASPIQGDPIRIPTIARGRNGNVRHNRIHRARVDAGASRVIACNHGFNRGRELPRIWRRFAATAIFAGAVAGVAGARTRAEPVATGAITAIVTSPSTRRIILRLRALSACGWCQDRLMMIRP